MAAPFDPIRRQGRRSLGLLAATLAVVLAAWLWMLRGEATMIYSIRVDDAVRDIRRWSGVDVVRVSGVLVHGSLVKRGSPCHLEFRLRSGDHELRVRHAECSGPELLCDLPKQGVEIVAEGRLSRVGAAISMDSTQIMAKCAGKHQLDPNPCAAMRPGLHCPMCEHVLTGSR